MKGVEARTIIAGKYRLDRPLAEGGMGAVWVGQHMALEIPIAVKFMDPKLLERSGEGWQKRFEREAKAAASLRHPQVVQIFDHGIEDGAPFIVMELLEGEDLGTRLKRSGPMRIEDAAWILGQTAKPLQRAHDLGVVHRDLKPGNLFIAKTGDDEIIKLLDFGIAKAPAAVDAGESTTTELVFGSPVYMSPEQATGSRDVDWRTDLWALGVIVFRVLTGTLPYRGTVGQVLLQICSGTSPSARAQRPDLPDEVDAFFRRAFATEPSDRFQSARDMATAFALIAGVSAPSLTLPTRAIAAVSVEGLQWDDDSLPSTAQAVPVRDAATAQRSDPPSPAVAVPRRSRRPLALLGAAVSIGLGGLVAGLVLRTGDSGAEVRPAPAGHAPAEASSAPQQPAPTAQPSAAPREASAAPEVAAAPPPTKRGGRKQAGGGAPSRQPLKPAPESSAQPASDQSDVNEFGY